MQTRRTFAPMQDEGAEIQFIFIAVLGPFSYLSPRPNAQTEAASPVVQAAARCRWWHHRSNASSLVFLRLFALMVWSECTALLRWILGSTERGAQIPTGVPLLLVMLR